MKRKTTFTILLFILSVPLGVFAQSSYERAVSWADSVYQSMTLEEQLGQLFIIRAHSNLGASHEAAVEQLIRKYKVGGLCFFQGTPERQVQLINRYQQISEEVPLLITMDAEWGLGMRMAESTISFPKQLMLGAIQNNRLIYEMGKEIARQLRRTGVHVNFAPVADINNNPNNPVINDRSFGEDRYNVTVKSYMYMKGMQERGVMASAKHFPGHGDTNVDSHYDLPVINYQRGGWTAWSCFHFVIWLPMGSEV
jgi:beta-N-acetylhexosaminidase